MSHCLRKGGDQEAHLSMQLSLALAGGLGCHRPWKTRAAVSLSHLVLRGVPEDCAERANRPRDVSRAETAAVRRARPASRTLRPRRRAASTQRVASTLKTRERNDRSPPTALMSVRSRPSTRGGKKWPPL